MTQAAWAIAKAPNSKLLLNITFKAGQPGLVDGPAKIARAKQSDAVKCGYSLC